MGQGDRSRGWNRLARPSSAPHHGPIALRTFEEPTMQVLPVDLTALLAVFMGISVVLIPIIGITARFALKPTVEALAKLFEHKGVEESVGVLERRMSLLEQQIESLD